MHFTNDNATIIDHILINPSDRKIDTRILEVDI